MSTHKTQHDVIVIGGGPAGLQAALTLGRMHRPVLVLDSGTYRNDPTHAMHNVAGFDGVKPADYRAAVHRDLTEYATVAVRDVAVTSVAGDAEAGFLVELADGTTARGRRLLLATGVRDTLPVKPGLEDLFGDLAAHCPYCHGHEFAGTHVALLGNGPHVAMVALLMQRIASRMTVLADGGELDPATRALLDRAGVAVRTEPVTGFSRSGSCARVGFESGLDEEVGGVMVATTFAQSAPFAAQLGLTLLPSGCVEVDLMGRTSLDGVYAAGDLAHRAELPMPMSAVLSAANAGLVAGSAADRDLMMADWGIPRPF